MHRDAIPGQVDREIMPGDPLSPPEAHGYSAVLIGPLLVGFTQKFLANAYQSRHRVKGADLERMERTYKEAVTAQLASEFPIVREPGQGVLRADALLIDHVLDKSDWLGVHLMFRTSPAVQVVVFLRDSESDELVDTVGVTMATRSSRLTKDSPGSYWRYMELVFDRVATRVRWALEDGVPGF